MSVKYDVYKSPPRDGEEQDMYHVRIKHTGTVTTDQLAERIEHDTSLTAGDVRNVLASLSHYFVACLSAGERIHLEGVGYFSLAAEAPAVASPREMRAEHVRVRACSSARCLCERDNGRYLGARKRAGIRFVYACGNLVCCVIR